MELRLIKVVGAWKKFVTFKAETFFYDMTMQFRLFFVRKFKISSLNGNILINVRIIIFRQKLQHYNTYTDRVTT